MCKLKHTIFGYILIIIWENNKAITVLWCIIRIVGFKVQIPFGCLPKNNNNEKVILKWQIDGELLK